MHWLEITGYVCLAAAGEAAVLPGAAEEVPQITVRLYNRAGVPERELHQAADEAAWIFQQAGLLVAWVQCPLNATALAADSPCREAPNSFAIGLLNQVPDFLSKGALGFALISSGVLQHGGIVYPRVMASAQRHAAEAERHQVLGYAIAHEVAHLILGSTAHGPSGILRREYTPAEFHGIGERYLLFSAGEAAQMRRRVRLATMKK